MADQGAGRLPLLPLQTPSCDHYTAVIARPMPSTINNHSSMRLRVLDHICTENDKVNCSGVFLTALLAEKVTQCEATVTYLARRARENRGRYYHFLLLRFLFCSFISFTHMESRFNI